MLASAMLLLLMASILEVRWNYFTEVLNCKFFVRSSVEINPECLKKYLTTEFESSQKKKSLIVSDLLNLVTY